MSETGNIYDYSTDNFKPISDSAKGMISRPLGRGGAQRAQREEELSPAARPLPVAAAQVAAEDMPLLGKRGRGRGEEQQQGSYSRTASGQGGLFSEALDADVALAAEALTASPPPRWHRQGNGGGGMKQGGSRERSAAPSDKSVSASPGGSDAKDAKNVGFRWPVGAGGDQASPPAGGTPKGFRFGATPASPKAGFQWHGSSGAAGGGVQGGGGGSGPANVGGQAANNLLGGLQNLLGYFTAMQQQQTAAAVASSSSRPPQVNAMTRHPRP